MHVISDAAGCFLCIRLSLSWKFTRIFYTFPFYYFSSWLSLSHFFFSGDNFFSLTFVFCKIDWNCSRCHLAKYFPRVYDLTECERNRGIWRLLVLYFPGPSVVAFFFWPYATSISLITFPPFPGHFPLNCLRLDFSQAF